VLTTVGIRRVQRKEECSVRGQAGASQDPQLFHAPPGCRDWPVEHVLVQLPAATRKYVSHVKAWPSLLVRNLPVNASVVSSCCCVAQDTARHAGQPGYADGVTVSATGTTGNMECDAKKMQRARCAGIKDCISTAAPMHATKKNVRSCCFGSSTAALLGALRVTCSNCKVCQ
jgi:hypothetical protein